MPNPKKSVRRRSTERSRVIPDRDHRAILDEAKRDQSPAGLRNLSLYFLLYFTGLRLGEALSLSVGQIFEGFSIRDRFWVRPEQTKGKRRGKWCALHDKHGLLRRALLTYHECRAQKKGYPQPEHPLFPGFRSAADVQKPMVQSCVWRWFRKLQKRVNILHPYTCHDIRHTFITRFYLQSGHDVRLTQAASGHLRLESLTRYIHTNPDDVCRVVAKM